MDDDIVKALILLGTCFVIGMFIGTMPMWGLF